MFPSLHTVYMTYFMYHMPVIYNFSRWKRAVYGNKIFPARNLFPVAPELHPASDFPAKYLAIFISFQPWKSNHHHADHSLSTQHNRSEPSSNSRLRGGLLLFGKPHGPLLSNFWALFCFWKSGIMLIH